MRSEEETPYRLELTIEDFKRLLVWFDYIEGDGDAEYEDGILRAKLRDAYWRIRGAYLSPKIMI